MIDTKSDAGYACYPKGHHRTNPTPQGLLDRPAPPNFDQRENCRNRSFFEYPPGNGIPLDPPVLHLKGEMYLYQHQMLNESYLLQNGKCQVSLGRYQWSFSFFLLFAFALVTFILSVCWSTTLSTYSNQIWPEQVDAIFGNLRSALVVARSIREELGSGVDDMTNDDLKESLTKVNAGVRRDYVGSKIMAMPGPERRKYHIPNFDVGSERYKAYLRHGYSTLGRGDPIDWDEEQDSMHS